ncbi:hypothetical protein BJY01DRAFT_129063 [Aspergillus pseudoustus]|uniref:Uncharacterized protein n=1 Tax=Aspergillus pseudoustus TaxID=1810923 RepID=A0ABR4ILK5_9EURO
MATDVRGPGADSQWASSLRLEAEGDRPFVSKNELAFFLERWMEQSGNRGDLGDVQMLYELLGRLNLNHQTGLCGKLDGLDLSRNPGSSYSQLADDYAPITLTPAIYLSHTMLASTQGKDKIDEVSSAETIPRRPKYEIEVVRDSLIWLNHLLSLGEGSADILLDEFEKKEQAIQVRRIGWLGSSTLKRRYTAGHIVLSKDEERDLKELWHMFEEHKSKPARYVFDLARLKIQGSLRFEWSDFHNATDCLTSECPNAVEFR